LEWPDDVVEVADGLGLDRFAVAGVSGGGPYVAACAFQIPGRLTAAGIISGVGPFQVSGATEGMSRQNRLLFRTARRLPWLLNLPFWIMAQGARRFPERAVDVMTRSMAEPDQRVLARPEVRAVFVESAAEAYRLGSRGAVWEAVMYSRPWGFRLEDITIEVYLWQGEKDVNVPPAMGRYLARAIPQCRAAFYPDEGHLLVVDHADEILAALFTSGGAS
jgi:pimeloyl-ACP methyl ester carboxylesterase